MYSLKKLQPIIYLVGYLASSSETNNIYVIFIPKIKVKATTNRIHTYIDHGLEYE